MLNELMNIADKRLFDHPNEFIPERWTSQPELTKDASVFHPFSMGMFLTRLCNLDYTNSSLGRYSCVGKQLGLMELRYVTSQVLRRYDVKLAPGRTPEQFLGGLKDGFTLATPGLNLVLTARKTE